MTEQAMPGPTLGVGGGWWASILSGRIRDGGCYRLVVDNRGAVDNSEVAS